MNMSGLRFFDAGTYLEMMVIQTSGGDLTVLLSPKAFAGCMQLTDSYDEV
jgi:hypothetical protein